MEFVTYKVTNEVVYFKSGANYCILCMKMQPFHGAGDFPESRKFSNLTVISLLKMKYCRILKTF